MKSAGNFEGLGLQPQLAEASEVPRLKGAILEARQQLWLELTELLKSCSIGEVEQILASGGNAYYWAKDLDRWLGARLNAGGALLDEIQFFFPTLQGSPLIYRGADCYRFWRSLPGMSTASKEVMALA